MAWPPSAIAADKANATEQVDDHAPHHNALADAINDLVAHGVNPHVGETPPESPTEGKPWFHSGEGRLYIRYDGAWVEILAGPGEPILQERESDATDIMWETQFTGTFDTGQADIARHRVGGVIRSWQNEWGALRGRNPFAAYADALVRAVIESGDFVSDGNAFEIVDRTLEAGPIRQKWGRRWNGTLVRNGLLLNDSIVLDHDDPVPDDLPTGTIIVRLEEP